MFLTLGYDGLIVGNAWLATSLRTSEHATALVTMRTAINVFRTFDPMGVGMLPGLVLAAWCTSTSSRLVAAYVLILCAMLLQGAIAAPWNVRTPWTLETSDTNATSVAAIATRAPATVAWGLATTLVLLALVTVWRPAQRIA